MNTKQTPSATAAQSPQSGYILLEALVALLIFGIARGLLPEGYRAPEADILHAALATTQPFATDVLCNLEELHARDGDHEVFLDEHGEMVPGQWMGSPTPNEHDILTGSRPDGTAFPPGVHSCFTATMPSPAGGGAEGHQLQQTAASARSVPWRLPRHERIGNVSV